MADWDGSGLPPAAHARTERATKGSASSSFLSIGDTVGLGVTGLSPVGDVMGAVAMYIGFYGWGGCGFAMGMAPMYTQLARTSGIAGFGPYLAAIESGWNGAIGRMLTECRSIGGGGGIGGKLEERTGGQGIREFVALGTAVRASRTERLAHPFATGLSGGDVAKLADGGYVPKAMVVAVSVGVRHDDYYSRMASAAFSPNAEVPAYSELVHAVRSDARDELARRLRGSGADGAILTANPLLRISELEVSEGHRDHVAESALTATAIVSFREHHGIRPPRTILSLADARLGK